MVRKGRGFQPSKVTGAGVGYVKTPRDDDVDDDASKSTKRKSSQLIAAEMSSGENFYRLRKKSGEIAADFSISASAAKAGRFTISVESMKGSKPNPGYVSCLRAVMRGVFRANGVIFDLRHQPRSIHGSEPVGRKVAIEFPIAIDTESELASLVKLITTPINVVSNIKRKSITERIVMEVKFPKNFSSKDFLENLIPHDGVLRNELV
jgi:hypothetical protein